MIEKFLPHIYYIDYKRKPHYSNSVSLTKKNQMIEREPIAKIVKAKKLIAYKHKYFWYCVDNLRDKIVLENLYKKDKKIW